jgi:hypothetical protein
MATNFHSNAAALILAAAKQSGLLDEIARALCFIDKVPNLRSTAGRASCCPLSPTSSTVMLETTASPGTQWSSFTVSTGRASRNTRKKSCGRISPCRSRCTWRPTRRVSASISTRSTTLTSRRRRSKLRGLWRQRRGAAALRRSNALQLLRRRLHRSTTQRRAGEYLAPRAN